jgi:spermidine/putrescine-binding protein
MNRLITKALMSGLLASVCAVGVTCAPSNAQQQPKTNIVVIWGDDVGQSNSAPIRAA